MQRRRRRLCRTLANFATAGSLALLVATAVVWIRSFDTADWAWARHDGVAWKAESAGGHLVLSRADAGDLGASLGPRGWQTHVGRDDGHIEAATLARTYDTIWSRLGVVAVGGRSLWEVNPKLTSSINADCRSIWVPYWLVTAIALVLPVWRAPSVIRGLRSSSPSPGRCPACGYDLRATRDRCPECGTVPPSAR